jgi:hypothetical protein
MIGAQSYAPEIVLLAYIVTARKFSKGRPLSAVADPLPSYI